MAWDVEALSTAVQGGIDANRKASNKWKPLGELLANGFEIDPTQIRCSLVADPGNATNRIYSDNARHNPLVLAIICVEEVTPDYVDRLLDAYHDKLREAGSEPKLRVALLFQDNRLLKIRKFGPTQDARSTEE